MAEILTPDICVIGGGSGGLTVAAASAAFGVDVVLVEKGKMGGDCLNYGCVPSKALIAAGHAALNIRKSGRFGVSAGDPQINFGKVQDHVNSVIEAIAPNDSVERFEGLGVRVVEAAGFFRDKKTLIAGGVEIKARRFVIATGSSASIPPIPGLEDVKFLTNETIFDQRRKPGHLVIIGGGPIGMELAQAYRHLGVKVTVLEAFSALSKDDPEHTKIVLDEVRKDGVDLREGVKILRIEKKGEKGARIVLENGDVDGDEETIDATHLLIATGRKPNIESLGLEEAGIVYEGRGITVSKSLRTSNRRVYAIGDVTGGLQFTHVAGYHAGLVIRSILFRMRARENRDIIPWVTFTTPELAHVGLSESVAAERFGIKNIRILRWPFSENDRAQAERKTSGHIKIITSKKGKILGAGIVGHNAGDLINMWSLAVSSGMNIKAMTGYVSPYPTFAEIGRRAAITYYSTSLGNPWIKRALNLLKKLG